MSTILFIMYPVCWILIITLVTFAHYVNPKAEELDAGDALVLIIAPWLVVVATVFKLARALGKQKEAK